MDDVHGKQEGGKAFLQAVGMWGLVFGVPRAGECSA